MELWWLLVLAPLGACVIAVGLLWLLLQQGKVEEVVAFFHPFTNDGGGGERVLWCAVRAVQEMAGDTLPVVIYTGDEVTPEALANRAFTRFGVKLVELPVVVRLHRRKWVESSAWPRFTMIGQSLGSMVLGWEALRQLRPRLFVDTSGYAFTYVLARAAGACVASYTHYPTISTDMLARVRSRQSTYNNNSRISRSIYLSTIKVWYYRAFALLYGLAGKCAQIVMVNSSWTKGHINSIWNIPSRTHLVYPPCDTSALQVIEAGCAMVGRHVDCCILLGKQELPLERSSQPPYIISVAQFRPEKAHELQLDAFANALEQLSVLSEDIHLKLVGSCRHQEDEERVESLKRKCEELGLQQYVDFCLNVSYSELVTLLGGATAGLHTMTDEHFGISVVEYMAAGAIPIAHNSAGPKLDIVVNEDGQQTGFLATTSSEFADAIRHVVTMSSDERTRIAKAARLRAARYSESRFDAAFKDAMSPFLERALR